MRLSALSCFAVLLAGSLSVAAQRGGRGQPPAASLVPEIEAWLECVECRDSEFEAVVKLGENAVPRLAPALLDGPPAEKRQSYDRYLRKMYADMKSYEKTHPRNAVPYSEDEFVKRDMARYENLYRVRAARALGAIGGPAAAKALDEALQRPLDPYVLTRVKLARGKIK